MAVAFVTAQGCAIERTGLASDGSVARLDAGDGGAPTDGSGDGPGPDAGLDAGCGATERCAQPSDEDCDGVIDEGCEWYFGRWSPLVRLHRSTAWHFSPVLSADGRRLYFRAETPGGPDLYVAERGSVAERFALPTAVPGTDFDAYVIYSFTLDDFETELIVEATPTGGAEPTRLHRAVRASTSEPFGALVPLTELSSAGRELNPHLSRDGLELFFASDRADGARIWRATRSAPGAPFSAPERVTIAGAPGPDITPHLTRDGLTLFFASNWRIWRATRESTDSIAFTDAAQVAGLPDDATTYFPFVSQPTREIFFTSQRAWSPTLEAQAIWRARICRDGACAEDSIDCPSGMRSEDGRHCYFAGEANATWGDARDVCRAAGGDLVTVHSLEEREVVRAVVDVEQWLGANDLTSECNVSIPGCTFDWVGDAPFLYAPWQGGQPNNGGGNEHCLAQRADGTWKDDRCSTANPYVCETELWPW